MLGLGHMKAGLVRRNINGELVWAIQKEEFRSVPEQIMRVQADSDVHADQY